MITFLEYLYESMSKRTLDHYLANPDGSIEIYDDNKSHIWKWSKGKDYSKKHF